MVNVIDMMGSTAPPAAGAYLGVHGLQRNHQNCGCCVTVYSFAINLPIITRFAEGVNSHWYQLTRVLRTIVNISPTSNVDGL